MKSLVALAAALGVEMRTPAAVCSPDRSAWTAPTPTAIEPLAALVAAQLAQPLQADDYGHAQARFDGEWWLGTYLMAAAGFQRAAQLDPTHAAANLARLSDAVERLLAPEVRGFDRAAWGDDMLEDLDEDAHDHAVLGYLGVALGFERLARPDSPHAARHDALVAALTRRMAARPPGSLLQTYPGESYPVDNAAVVATLALHARATGQPLPPVLGPWLTAWEARWVDPATGLLIQAADGAGERPRDLPRGSGTALASWFLSFADPALAGRLGAATRDQLGVEILGMAAVREYLPGVTGPGDVDSGPLILGLSVAASGFSIGAARAAGDADWQGNLLDTACLFAAETDDVHTGHALTGGPLGNAILLAMLTTPTPEEDR